MTMLREFAGISTALFLAGGVAVFLLSTPPQPPVAAPTAKVTKGKLPPIAKPVIVTAKNSHIPSGAVLRGALPAQALAVAADMSGEEVRVATRLASRVPAQVAPYFDVFIYVSKAPTGAWAQQLYLFNKSRDGELAFEEKFVVSTGRERAEQYFTTTPTGLFQLDAKRFFRMTYSSKWNGAAMPFAMFLNVDYRTQKSGIALHAAHGTRGLADLGTRASGGCVRLPPEKAEQLFDRFRTQEQGSVPVFAFDESRGATSAEGRMLHDANGKTYMVHGVRVLVLIENYAGEIITAANFSPH